MDDFRGASNSISKNVSTTTTSILILKFEYYQFSPNIKINIVVKSNRDNLNMIGNMFFVTLLEPLEFVSMNYIAMTMILSWV